MNEVKLLLERAVSKLSAAKVLFREGYFDDAVSRAYYREVPELEGVWATGKTLEGCRKNLVEVIDGWIVVRLRKSLQIPPIGEYKNFIKNYIVL